MLVRLEILAHWLTKPNTRNPINSLTCKLVNSSTCKPANQQRQKASPLHLT